VLQVLAILAMDRGARGGFVASAIVGFGWAAIAAYAHLPDIIATADYRFGIFSKGPTLVLIGLGIALTWSSIASVWSERRQRRLPFET
jgi:hypothetical protein